MKQSKKITILSLILVATTIIVVFITNTLSQPKKLVIDNFSDYYSNIPNYLRDRLFESLYKVVDSTEKTLPTPTSGALILEENRTDSTFIVDINSIHQAYLILLPEDLILDETIYIACPKYTIYEDFNCNIQDETIPNAKQIWQNTYILSYTVGEKTAQKIFNYFNSVLDKNIDSFKIKENKFIRIEDFTYSMDFVDNNNNLYHSLIKTDSSYGQKYIAIYLKTDSIEKAHILTNNTSNITEVSNWLTKQNKNLKITYSEL